MERRLEKVGVPAIVAFAAVVIILYSLWGASVLGAAKQAAAGGAPAVVVNR